MDLWMRVSCFGARWLDGWTVLQSEMVHNFQNYFRVACHELASSMSDCAPGRVTKIAIGLADFCCYG
jgi:hypothetical protein